MTDCSSSRRRTCSSRSDRCPAKRNLQQKHPARRYHRNQQYSITALTDATGTISERYAYSAYGKLTVLDGGGTVLGGSAYGNRYTYTGREWDHELGLYHYRARMYSPDSGRFCSRDLIGYLGSPWSLYEFVVSTPLTLVDPEGLTPNELNSRQNLASGVDATSCTRRCRGGNRSSHVTCLMKCQKCARELAGWVEREERLGSNWLDDLPDCPCTIKEPRFYHHDRNGRPTDRPAGDPDSWPVVLPKCWEWDDAKSYPFAVWVWTGVWDFHPGSAYCIRSNASKSGGVQQCCYDSEGIIITEGTGVGTPDRGSGSEHGPLDVDPFLCAKYLDGGFAGPHIDLYLRYRPPSGGYCGRNPTSK